MRNDSQQRGLHWLNIGRWWICGTGLCVIAPLVPAMFRNYRKWHAAIGGRCIAGGFLENGILSGRGAVRGGMLVGRSHFFRFEAAPRHVQHRLWRVSGATETIGHEHAFVVFVIPK